jgi:poly-gamma-glutamate synthase PgsB/CapB
MAVALATDQPLFSESLSHFCSTILFLPKGEFVSGTLVLVTIAVSTGTAFVVEGLLYRRRLARIPIRIHVNGTRGKSSVTRLIAAGLRAGGIRTCAKTTGTLARMILCDGSELPIFRPGRANVIEQKRVVRAANEEAAEALVIECMALQPALQSVCELKLVRSSIGVITNARADHLDIMGPTRLDVARALAGTTPIAGELFTAEHRDDSLTILADAAKDRGSRLHVVGQDDSRSISASILSRFSYMEHPDNVALAVAVCQAVGVPQHVALEGMWAAAPDPGAMRIYRHLIEGKFWYFVNAFAANDPESTGQIWRSAADRFPGVGHRVVVMNCRADRPDRSTTMADECANWSRADAFLITGTGTDLFLRQLLKAGVDDSRIVCLGEATIAEIITAVSQLSPAPSLILGIGNIAGCGMRLIDYFENSHCTVLTNETLEIKEPAPYQNVIAEVA